MGRKRKIKDERRRKLLGCGLTGPSSHPSACNGNFEIVPEPPPFGGVMWRGDDLAGDDFGFSLMERFIKEHPHDDWSLSIFDSVTQSTVEIECATGEMPQIVAYIYSLEHAAPMTFIGESPLSDSYVVGMRCVKGRLDIPGVYTAENGKLVRKLVRLTS